MQSNQISINCEMTISIALIQSSMIRMFMMTNDTEIAYLCSRECLGRVCDLMK